MHSQGIFEEFTTWLEVFHWIGPGPIKSISHDVRVSSDIENVIPIPIIDKMNLPQEVRNFWQYQICDQTAKAKKQ